jgi:hypothetical protein
MMLDGIKSRNLAAAFEQCLMFSLDDGEPPIPDPINTPVRSARSGPMLSPDCFIAVGRDW